MRKVSTPSLVNLLLSRYDDRDDDDYTNKIISSSPLSLSADYDFQFPRPHPHLTIMILPQ